MKNFFERGHRLIRQQSLGLHEKSGHLALPPFVDLARSHSSSCALKILSLQIADQEAIRPKEERVIVPARFPERADHFWPNRAVALLVFGEKLSSHLKYKTDSLHTFTRSATPANFFTQR
jgi:hypothetical protein